MTRRFGQRAVLKPECVEEYIRLHRAVWPDVLATITRLHLHNYSIYIAGTELFAYFEYTGSDFEADMKRMEDDPVTQEWWKLTKPCFAHYEKSIFYVDMEEIFHLD